ncbi:phospho-N-acetylmuramoyl-pentapeptide-transferase [Clostridium sp. 'White wine YQ']|uniref:phospho-N-acetylmuramoyl-pentapeptide- transferase n=1 Tax=Clostridium sp. 'White wine YQ' TaxID=3027474 RepID=UPI002365571A|nr:phospho-N-acetylmuramoyl-pentapeptide-transferase [Clostridium sp. 'White wine YQ']MDD7793974.1 phospho-N-acetylmuramoyl-pentapeptide-transferase [Clostridium sp. 'White wine YQ']
MENMKSMLNPDIIMAIVLGFAIATIIGGPIIKLLYKLKFGQNIREDGPRTHLKKAGTPTIGGLIFIFSTIIATFIMISNIKDEAIIALLAFVAFGFIGFLDDILKIIRKNNLGLRAYQKMILLLLVSSLLAYYGYVNVGTKINIPFVNAQIDIGIFYIPFIIFYFASETNAVNLTDGLDGLATSITVLVMTFLSILSFNLGHYSLSIFCVILAGALLGFLRFNAFPARVFMGDTGSLALGGAVATVGLLLKVEFLIVIIGGIYVLEALSVVIQVASFKLTGKRVFKMAPIHHHFEQLGWKETKVVTVFSIITLILCFIGFLSL